MSNKRQNHVSMKFVKLKCRNLIVLTLACAILVAILPTKPVQCAKLVETQLQRLINDDDLLQMREPKHAPAAEAINSDSGASVADNEHERFHLYRSELKRLSYETIHRILRDENEPIYRREDTELRYYRKRSYQPTHEVVRRSTQENGKAFPKRFLNLKLKNLTEFSVINKTFDCQTITEIDLSRNRLKQLNLTGCDQLQILDVSENELTALPIAANDSALVSLNLNGNRLAAGTTPTNFHLRELHLSANKIQNLGALNLSLLDALETLDLSCNRIADLDTTFFPQRMHNLKHLNLAHNRLDAIFRETFYNLLSLNTLLLTQNNISDIDYETFLALPNLQYLDLSYNQLNGESIRALQGIPDLVGLSIAYNPNVGSSMQEFVASWSLKELDASGTGLCQIPAALAQSVRTLKLTDNWLKVINCGDLDSYPLLQYLDLSHSRIEDIEDDALGRLEILEILFLDHNSLRKVPISLPTSLEHLFLQNNQIMDIQIQSLQGLNNLQTLDLSGNKLLYLPALPLPKLLTLNLQSSGLKGLSQAIVHTLPQLRDLLLEDNPIKCSDLLGIAEWASPCRTAERSSNSGISSAGAEVADNSDREQIVGQQQQPEMFSTTTITAAEIDLKQKFVQMHNFFEKFKSKCGVHRLNTAVVAADTAILPPTPPSCAIKMNDMAEVEDASEVAAPAPITKEAPNKAAEVISFILPSEAPTKNEELKVYELNQNKNLKTKITETLPEAAANNKAAVTAATAAAVVAATTITTLTKKNTTRNWAETNNVRTILEATKTLQDAAGATTSLVEQQITKTTPATATGTATTATATAALTITTTSTATLTNTEHANHDEPKRSQTSQQTTAKYVAVVTAATAAEEKTATLTTKTTAAVDSEKLPQATTNTNITAKATHNPSTSSLNISKTFSNSKNLDGITTTITTTSYPTPKTYIKTTTRTSATTQTNDETMHVPQTISTTIKSDNNYVEATGLLSQKGFKTSATIAAVETTTATATATAPETTATDMPTTTTDKDFGRINDSNNDNNKVVDRRQQKNNFKRAQPNINGISGQQNVAGSAPTTEKIILASQKHSMESLPSIATPTHIPTLATTTIRTTKTAAHRHEPLQLHIKDRHLIGTPLLMHNGQNILVEAAEQLMMLPATTLGAKAPAAGAPNASKTPATSTMKTLLVVETNYKRYGKGSESSILDESQHRSDEEHQEVDEANDEGTKWLRDITGLTETDKNPITETINEKTNEHYIDETEEHHAKLATSHVKDKQNTTKEEIVKLRKLEEETHTTAKKLKKHDDNKKKMLSLTMKKMTITKQSHPQKQKQPQHHMLSTPRENEAIGQRDNFDVKLFKELKPVNIEDKLAQQEEQTLLMASPTTHKHSTVNTPTGGRQPYELNTFAQQHELSLSVKEALHIHAATAHLPEVPSKSEPLFDIRKATTTGHPGLVILLSFSLFVILLVGLMRVYRCELPWRRHLLSQQRPHQRQLNEDDAHSFLNYHNNSQSTTNPINMHPKWHHSARLQQPYSSPLHNLHVRELQKTSAIEEKSNRCKQFYSASLVSPAPYFGECGVGATATSVPNSDGSHTSSLSTSSHSSAILDDDAFYIEMTPDSGQAEHTLHSDLLPMELLNVPTSRRSLDDEMEACNDLIARADGVRQSTTGTQAQSNAAELGYNFVPIAGVEDGNSVPMLAPTTRKFGLW